MPTASGLHARVRQARYHSPCVPSIRLWPPTEQPQRAKQRRLVTPPTVGAADSPMSTAMLLRGIGAIPSGLRQLALATVHVALPRTWHRPRRSSLAALPVPDRAPEQSSSADGRAILIDHRRCGCVAGRTKPTMRTELWRPFSRRSRSSPARRRDQLQSPGDG